ncbi:hypothetical protein [Aeromicrobium sp. CTD01-1L150]|uniref:hypothetical protein n=1 Tax=Aeromicrobium sp. CTD01-1L150 TaxID=3341830 RepID=UPI0035C19178
MRRTLTLVVALGALLAGCVGDDGPADEPTPGPPATAGSPSPDVEGGEQEQLAAADDHDARLRAELFVKTLRTYSWRDGEPNAATDNVRTFMTPGVYRKWAEENNDVASTTDWNETVRLKREGTVDVVNSELDSAFDQTGDARTVAVQVVQKSRSRGSSDWSQGDSLLDYVWLERGPGGHWYVTKHRPNVRGW